MIHPDLIATETAPYIFTAARQELPRWDARWNGCWAVSRNDVHGHNIMPLMPRACAEKAAHMLNQCETREEQRVMMSDIRAKMREAFGENIRCYRDYPAAVRNARFVRKTT